MSGVGWYQLYFFHSEASGILHRRLLIILFNGNYFYLSSWSSLNTPLIWLIAALICSSEFE
jgi:hypothetical protein